MTTHNAMGENQMTMHIGHVALRVSDLDRAVRHAQTVLGLHESSRTSEEAYLTSNAKHHELQLRLSSEPGLDHVGLEVESPEAVDRIAQLARDAGAEMIEGKGEQAIGRSVRFAGPGGVTYEVYDGMERGPLTREAFLGPHIRKLGHLTFFSVEHAEMVSFWREVLGFRLSDTADGITWMRCDSDHHGLAVAPHPTATLLHHHAWEVQDFAALGQYCDNLARVGLSLLWGPVRHGPGFNLATYLGDPDGLVVEVYADLMRIVDERAYTPVDWTDEPRALNLWGPMPQPEFMGMGLPVRDLARR
jgi:catechol 2,3-dioxygenase